MAEKRVIELEIKSDSVGTLKSQLKAAQNEVNELAAKFGATSQEAVNAAKKAALLKDAIADAKSLTDSFNPDGKFNALSASIGGALNGFQAFEGAMGLLGVESEDLQKTLLKVQSAMALSQGVQGLLEAKDSFKQLGAVAADALKGIRTGIAATGIGLLVIAVGTLVAYWDDIKEAISGVSSEQEALNIKSQADVDLQKEKLDTLGSQDNILKLQGLTEKQILQLKIKQTDEAIKAYEISIKNQEQTLKAQIQAEQRNKEILKGILKFILAPINLLLKTVDEIGAFLGKDWNLQDQVMDWTASLIFDPKEVEDEGMKAIAESKKALAELKNQQAGFKLEVQAIDKQAADERKKAQKEANDKRIADQKEADDKLKKQAEELQQFYKDQREADNERAVTATLGERKQVKDKLDLLWEAAQEESRIKKEARDAEAAADKEAKDKEKQRVKELNAAKIDAVQNTLNTIANLAQLFAGKSEKQQKKAFEIQKAVNIAQATIDTYKAATGAYASLSSVPVVGPVLGAAAAAAAIVAGLANVKNIASQKFEGGGSMSAAPAGGGGGSGGGGAGASNVITPNFNIVGNAQATNPLAGLGTMPLQAYVVSGDVTTAQSLDRNRINYATFG